VHAVTRIASDIMRVVMAVDSASHVPRARASIRAVGRCARVCTTHHRDTGVVAARVAWGVSNDPRVG